MRTIDKMEMARRLRDARGKMSVRDAAEAIGVSRSTLSMYEIGRRVPKDEIKIRIAAVYGVPIQDLFYGGDCHI